MTNEEIINYMVEKKLKEEKQKINLIVKLKQ